MHKILVVDDNLANLQQVSALLKESHTIIPAKSGAQALHIATKQPPDLILLDIDMPEMDGFETLRHLQANARLSDIPVIFLTANHEAETEIHGLQAGAKDFITKPFEKSILTHRIDLHLRLSAYHRQMQHTVRELENNIVINFAELIECRDENTGGHVQRTSRYFELLGKELIARKLFTNELDDWALDMMARAAPLHDIGKIGVSDAALLKPGKLDDAEFAAIKKHPRIGADILRAMQARVPTQHYLRYAVQIAESHHERWDGKGYPDGLAGENIPLCARIMSVVDVYDALVSHRVYRKAMPHEAACDIIFSGENAAFDPAIVAIFREIHENLRVSD